MKKSSILYLLKVNINKYGENVNFGFILINDKEIEVYIDDNRLKALSIILNSSSFKEINNVISFFNNTKLTPSDIHCFPKDKNGILEFQLRKLDGIYSKDKIIKIYL